MSLIATTAQEHSTPVSLKRRVWSWVGVIAILVLIGSLLATLRFEYEEPQTLSIDSPRYDGARALGALLERAGVDVATTDSLADARSLTGRDDVLVVTDASLIAPDDLADLADGASRTVVLKSDFAALDEFFPGIGYGGSGDGSPVAPSCEIPEAAYAGDIIPGEAYRVDAADGCYPVGDGYALVTDGSVFALDGLSIVTNEYLADAGHAALALALLADTGSVVWYSPSGADAEGGAETLGDVVPTWVTPLILLAGLVAIAAAIWRGRRFGPLVAENLPVTVRAAETLEGRARLYRDGSDPAHAYEALTRGATARMARRLSLPTDAGADSLAAAIAARTRYDLRQVHETLTATPTNDTHLADLGARLREIETAIETSDPWEGRSR